MPSPQRVLIPIVAVIALGLLASCTFGTPGLPSDATGPAAPSSTSQPDPAPSLSPTSVPVDVTCDQLISADTMYAFNSNYGLVDYTPADGSVGAAALDSQGVVCRWQNQTSNDTIDLSVANLDAVSIEKLREQAATKSTLATLPSGDSYFTTSGGVGVVVAFASSYWIVMSSGFFSEAADATDLLDSVVAALPG
jgi:hypothetical protein